jgi:hypothetical protein
LEAGRGKRNEKEEKKLELKFKSVGVTLILETRPDSRVEKPSLQSNILYSLNRRGVEYVFGGSMSFEILTLGARLQWICVSGYLFWLQTLLDGIWSRQYML